MSADFWFIPRTKPHLKKLKDEFLGFIFCWLSSDGLSCLFNFLSFMSESRIFIFTNTQGYPLSISDCVPIYSISNERVPYLENNSLDPHFLRSYNNSKQFQIIHSSLFGWKFGEISPRQQFDSLKRHLINTLRWSLGRRSPTQIFNANRRKLADFKLT